MNFNRLLRRGTLTISCLAVCVAASATAAGQDEQASQRPTFGADVRLVLVDLTVIDGDGRFVHGLSRERFRVFEEDQPVDVTFFAVERFGADARDLEAPVAADDGTENPSVGADEGTEEPVAPLDDGTEEAHPLLSRYIVLFVDALNTTPADWMRLRPHVMSWLENGLQPNDRVLVAELHPNRRVRMTREFSRDKEVLTDAIMQVQPNGDLLMRVSQQEREVYEVLGVEAVPVGAVPGTTDGGEAARLRQGAQLAHTFAQQRSTEVRFALEYLVELAAHLDRTLSITGPKVVVMVSSGLPDVPGLNYNFIVEEQLNRSSPLTRSMAGMSTFSALVPEKSTTLTANDDLLRAIGRFNRLNYLFYTINARGVGDADGAQQPYSSLLSAGYESEIERNEQMGLIHLAEGTGGLAFFNSVDFDSALRRVQEDTAYRYVLGYVPPPHDPQEVAKDKFYRIDVEVDLPGVTVRARRGYLDANDG